MPEAFCPRCVCRYEQRNTTIIKFVVIMILCVIGFLTTYMAYLFFVDPIIVKWKQNSYRQQREEEVSESIDAVYKSVNNSRDFLLA